MSQRTALDDRCGSARYWVCPIARVPVSLSFKGARGTSRLTSTRRNSGLGAGLVACSRLDYLCSLRGPLDFERHRNGHGNHYRRGRYMATGNCKWSLDPWKTNNYSSLGPRCCRRRSRHVGIRKLNPLGSGSDKGRRRKEVRDVSSRNH